MARPSFARAAFLDAATAALALLVANIVLIAAVMSVALFRAAAGGAMPDVDKVTADNMPAIIVAAVSATLVAALATWVLRSRRLPSLTAMPAARAYPFAIGAGVAIQLVCIAIVLASRSFGSPIEPSNGAPLEEMAARTPWLTWLIAGLVAPVGEELLFRHVLVRRFAIAGRAVLGIVLVSAVFALMHEPVPGDAGAGAWLAALALYGAMGAGFGAVYVRTGRLGAAIAAHAACNLLALATAAFSTL